jgi:hypothetical protein
MSLPLEFLDKYDGPLVWGVNDCVQFAAGGVEYFGGWRPAIPPYKTEMEAARIIVAGDGLANLVMAAMGDPRPLMETEIGDVVYTAFQDTGPMLGVADPPGFWVRASVDQGKFLPLELQQAIMVWSCRQFRSSSTV